jgi:hypothetical protein
VPRQNPATGRHAQSVGLAVGDRHSAFALDQGFPLDHVDARAASKRREGQPDRTFGEAIYRRDRLAAQAIGSETLGKGG